jgi:TolA-binding protein
MARYGLAVSLYRLDRFEEAATELTSLRDTPDCPYPAEVGVVLGQCRLAGDAPDEAAAAFARVLRDHGEHDLADEAAALLAEALHEAGRYDDVETPAALIVERWPESPVRERAELYRGMARMARGAYGEAADQLAALSRRSPDGDYAAQTELLLAQAWHRTDALDDARRQYRAVVDRADETTLADGLLGLGTVLHQAGELDGAGAATDRLLALEPEPDLEASARLLRGRIWFDQEEYERAFAQLEQAGTIPGDHRDDASWWMAKSELRLGRPQEAARRLERALERFEESELRAEMAYDLGVALLRSGEDEAAIEALSGFRAAHGDHELAPDALQVIAFTEHQRGRYAASLELCNRFYEQHPDHAARSSIVFLAAENLFLAGEHEQASGVYRQYLDRHPDGDQAESARFRLGMARYHLEDFDGARPLLEQVTDGAATAPEFQAALLALGDLHSGLDLPAADDAMLKLGLARQRQDRAAEALATYEQLLGQFQDSPHRLQATFESGQALVTLDRPDEATAAFGRVLGSDPDSRFAAHALNHLGAIALARGDYDTAAECFGRVAAHDEARDLRSEALFQQGQSLVSAGSFDDAESALGALIDTDATHGRVPPAAALRAIAVARSDRHEDALALIEAVEREHAEDVEADLLTSVLYEKAWCQRQLDRPEPAASSYRQLLDQADAANPLRMHALLELAELEADARLYEPAAGHLRELLAAASAGEVPGDLAEQAHYRLAVCEFRLERFDTASDLFERFLGEFPDSEMTASASLLCGESLFRIERHGRAVDHLARLEREFEGDESFGPGLLRLGECHAALQRWDDSEAVFTKYLDRFPESPQWYQARFGLGWALENQERYDPAIDSYRQVVSRHEGETAARAQFQIGECLFADKRYDEAVRELLKVDILYGYPEWSAAALYEAGRCFEEMSDPVAARRQFEQLVRDHEGSSWALLARERLETMSRTGLPGQ